MEDASVVLPTPGGPTRQRIGARISEPLKLGHSRYIPECGPSLFQDRNAGNPAIFTFFKSTAVPV